MPYNIVGFCAHFLYFSLKINGILPGMFFAYLSVGNIALNREATE